MSHANLPLTQAKLFKLGTLYSKYEQTMFIWVMPNSKTEESDQFVSYQVVFRTIKTNQVWCSYRPYFETFE